MKKRIELDTSDIKTIIAKYFHTTIGKVNLYVTLYDTDNEKEIVFPYQNIDALVEATINIDGTIYNENE